MPANGATPLCDPFANTNECCRIVGTTLLGPCNRSCVQDYVGACICADHKNRCPISIRRLGGMFWRRYKLIDTPFSLVLHFAFGFYFFARIRIGANASFSSSENEEKREKGKEAHARYEAKPAAWNMERWISCIHYLPATGPDRSILKN